MLQIMRIKKYLSEKDLKAAYDSCNGRKSDIFNSGYCISFREYDKKGNTLIFHKLIL